MSCISIWVHCVWATKNRLAIMDGEVRRPLFNYMVGHARNNGIFIDRINGSNDHVHVLLSLGADQGISRVVQVLKGASTYWLNRSGLLPFRFGWQDDYFAVSVSESQVEKVREYIDRQVEHHQVKSFADEYQEFIDRFGFTRQADGTIRGKR